MPKRVVAAWLVYFCAIVFGAAAAVKSDRVFPSDWHERQKLFDTIRAKRGAGLEDSQKVLAINLLDYETRHIHAKVVPDDLGEAHGDYYIDLALFVKNLHDPRSITALSGAVDVANSISTTLAEFGDAAVDAVASRIAEPELASDAIFTLGKFVEGRRLDKNHLSDAYEARIRKLLLEACVAPDAHVRLQAATALQYFPGDQEVVAALRRLAASDTYVHSSARKRAERRPTDYPVRQAALKSLAVVEKGTSQ